MTLTTENYTDKNNTEYLQSTMAQLCSSLTQQLDKDTIPSWYRNHLLAILQCLLCDENYKKKKMMHLAGFGKPWKCCRYTLINWFDCKVEIVNEKCDPCVWRHLCHWTNWPLSLFFLEMSKFFFILPAFPFSCLLLSVQAVGEAITLGLWSFSTFRETP